MTLPKDFIGYVRGYPTMLETLFRREADRLQRDPSTAAWFQKNLPGATPQEVQTRVQQQAAINANALGRRAFDEARTKYGVKQFTPQDLHEALSVEANARADALANDPLVLRAAKGADMAAHENEYRSKTVPEGVNRDVAMLSPYLPFDEQAQKQTKVEQPVKPTSAAKADEGERKPAAAPAPDDPLLRGLVNVMKDTGQQQQQQQQRAPSAVLAAPTRRASNI